MKVSRIIRQTPDGPQLRVVAVLPDDQLVVDLRTAERLRLQRSGATASAARRIARATFPGGLAESISGGEAFRASVAQVMEDPDAEALLRFTDVEWAAAVDPPVMIDASAFIQHLVNAHARGKRTVPDFFYQVPAYYKMNPVTTIGHDATVSWPPGARFMDYELEFAVVIGATGSDIEPGRALDHVFGLTVMNDFSARDLQAREMAAGFGPVKGKDFGTALGPWVTTLDELDLDDLTMLARVNGEEWSRGSSATLTWSIEEIVAYASRGEVVVPGQVIGSGTVGLGSGLEIYRKLSPGDVVELEIEGLGVLRNTVGEPVESWWEPETKPRDDVPTLPTRTA